jgi:hypothetical protein
MTQIVDPDIPETIDLLVLGAGWLYQFLTPLLQKSQISYVGTTRDGRNGTLRFDFDYPTPSNTDMGNDGVGELVASSDSANEAEESKSKFRRQFRSLPNARVVLVTFPVKGREAMKVLVDMYDETHQDNGEEKTKWILLGSTGIWGSSRSSARGKSTTSHAMSTPASSDSTVEVSVQSKTVVDLRQLDSQQVSTSSQTPRTSQPPQPRSFKYVNHKTPPTTPSPRLEAEQYLLSSIPNRSTVLNLSGLYGEPSRDRAIFERGAPRTKEGVGGKGSVHFIHGVDVGRVIVGICEGVCRKESTGREHGVWERVRGQRWLLTDLRVYDWWEIVWDNAEYMQRLLEDSGEAKGGKAGIEKGLTYREWVLELMREQGVQSLPREVEVLKRVLDGRDVWEAVGMTPMGRKFGWPVKDEKM